MTRIFQNTHFNRDRNMTTVFGQRLAGYMYDEELAGPDGMHFHVWVPKGTTQTKLREIAKEIRSNQDMVSMSYDFID